MANDAVLTAAQMRAAEDEAIAGGTSVEELMRRAGVGAAEWVWRMAAGHSVTVLCGPGNNGGDGYVLAEAIRRKGGAVKVVAPLEPATEAAKAARAAYDGEVVGRDGPYTGIAGAVLVDCLFGTGFKRKLTPDLVELLMDLAEAHRTVVAVDIPSGIDADTGAVLASHFRKCGSRLRSARSSRRISCRARPEIAASFASSTLVSRWRPRRFACWTARARRRLPATATSTIAAWSA